MSKRDPALQLLLAQQRMKEAEIARKAQERADRNARRDAERAETAARAQERRAYIVAREAARAARSEAWLALSRDRLAAKQANIAAHTGKKSRARIQAEIDSAAKLAYDKAYHEDRGLPWPPQTTREPTVIHLQETRGLDGPGTPSRVLNPGPTDLDLNAMEQAQARRSAQIAADIAAHNERLTQEHLAALTPAELARLAKRQQEMDDTE